MPADMRERLTKRAESADSPLQHALERSGGEPLPWGEPSRAPARGRRHALMVAVGGSLAAAAALALWLTAPRERISVESEHPAPLQLAARPYTSDELRAL